MTSYGVVNPIVRVCWAPRCCSRHFFKQGSFVSAIRGRTTLMRPHLRRHHHCIISLPGFNWCSKEPHPSSLNGSRPSSPPQSPQATPWYSSSPLRSSLRHLGLVQRQSRHVRIRFWNAGFWLGGSSAAANNAHSSSNLKQASNLPSSHTESTSTEATGISALCSLSSAVGGETPNRNASASAGINILLPINNTLHPTTYLL